MPHHDAILAIDVSVLDITGPNVSKIVAEVTTSLQSLKVTDHQGYNDDDNDAYYDPIYLNTVTDLECAVTIVNKKVLFKVIRGGGSHSEQGAIQIVKTPLHGEKLYSYGRTVKLGGASAP